jgi:hypothetical protein
MSSANMAMTHCRTNRCARSRGTRFVVRATRSLKTCASLSAALRVTATRLLRNRGGPLLGEEEGQGAVPLGQLVELHPVHRLAHLLVEVVDPELVEVAEGDVARPVAGPPA